MIASTKRVPQGFQTVTPYLCCDDAMRAIEFYKRAFGASEIMSLTEPNGRVGHAEIRIGDAIIMLADESPEGDARSPHSLGGSPVKIHLYVDDADTVANRAVAAGARLLRAVSDQFYGDRSGQLLDPAGHVWIIATHREDVPGDEIRKRYNALLKQ